MTAGRNQFDRKALYDAAMDAAYAFRPEGWEKKLGETMGALSPINGLISDEERAAKAVISKLAKAIVDQSLTVTNSPKYTAAAAKIEDEQKAVTAYFKFTGPKDAAWLTTEMRANVKSEIARQTEAREAGAALG